MRRASSTLAARLPKILLVGLISAGVFLIARASLQESLYMPLVPNVRMTNTPTPSLTPTQTQTGTITITVTPTRTPTITGTLPTATLTSTPTRTPTPIPGVFIIDIEYAPETHPLDEYVEIRNQNREYIPMQGWTLRDDSQNIFTFPRYTLISGATVKIWTKSGINDPDNLYWGRTTPVWNDFGDCAYLRDDKNDLSDSECYGSKR